MKGRDRTGGYPDEVALEVSAANRERREIELPAGSFEKLGHHKRNPILVMRAFCIDCMGGQYAEVRRCTSVGCVLWPYRFGKNPFTDRKGPVRP